MEFDYIRVYEIPAEEEEEVPGASEWYYSQRDPGWGKDEYDSAKKWSCKDSNIENWGCAMTDAAMILKRYKIGDTDGTAVTPGELNTWLMGQPDGYLGNGLTNWLAVTRLAKNSFENGQVPHGLEYVREAPEAGRIGELLGSKLLPIVNTGGHFVTIYEEQDADNWLTADPYVGTESALPKATTLTSMGYFTPSKTDLSYFLITSEPGATVIVYNEAGEELPLYTTQEFLQAEQAENKSKTLKISTLAKPVSGKYKIVKSGHGEISLYLYDKNGAVKKETLKTNTEYIINYDQLSSGSSTVEKLDTTPPVVVITTPETTSIKKIEGTASDESGIKKVELAIQVKKWWRIPFNLWIRVMGAENWSLPARYLPNGEYRVRVRATDTAGNTSEPVEKMITLTSVKNTHRR